MVMGRRMGINLILAALFCVMLWPTPGWTEPAHSPYAGQESRSIVSLSPKDIEGLKAGSGTPFGGMALPAELNGYPGPRHVLDLEKELKLTAAQKARTEKIFGEMKVAALALGEKIISTERKMDQGFKQGSMTADLLKKKVSESARLQGELRHVHLKAHLAMMEVLSRDQVKLYGKLRGYASKANPCEEVPAGHDPQMWKLHHGCG